MLVVGLIIIILVMGVVIMADDDQMIMIEWTPEYGEVFRTRAGCARFDNGEYSVVMLSAVVPLASRGGSMVSADIPLTDDLTVRLACGEQVLGSSMSLVVGIGANDTVLGTFTTNGKQSLVGGGVA